MPLIKEPKDVDLLIQSKPWTEEELAELSAIIRKSKEARLKKRKGRISNASKKEHEA